MREKRCHPNPHNGNVARTGLSVMLAMSLALLPACANESGNVQGAGTQSGNAGTPAASATYESLLFDDSRVHEIDVVMKDRDWQDLLDNPTAKTKYVADVTIDGEKVKSVSFATKGNSSLSSVASNKDSNRYAFKINFGKFVDRQTYHGLNKLNLSNIFADATYMKDYVSYEIFRKVGVNAPLTSYTWLKVNGEDIGLYLAIEEIGDSYLNRVYGGKGELYKPESDALDAVNNQDEPARDEKQEPERDKDKAGDSKGEKGQEPSAPTSPKIDEKGADLAYVDDEIESYSAIFDNDETDADKASNKRVIEALKLLSEGKADEAVDTDEVIAYFVAHNFVLNHDGYTGIMGHNYYLYESDGKLAMLPWDYNLAFGGFGKGRGGDRPAPGSADKGTDKDVANVGERPERRPDRQRGEQPVVAPGEEAMPEDAAELINFGIDSPMSAPETVSISRPMWQWIQDNKDYTQQYYDGYDKLLTGYFDSGEFEKDLEKTYKMIRPYVEKDPSSFYDVDKFDKAYETLRSFCLLRAESVRAQIDGKLATKTSRQDEKQRVEAKDIVIADMGRPEHNDK